MKQYRSLRQIIKALTFLVVVLTGASVHAVVNPVGGGILDGGLEGRYYSDTSFGTEAFVRRDLRLDFDWGSLRKPGGSLAWTKLGQLGADNYSVRWEGRLMARFSETYTIRGYADSVRIWIKPEGAAWGSALIDYWPGTDPTGYTQQSASFAFVAGQAYDIRVEYRERSGPAMMRLSWSSPSTPEEVIQPTAMVGEIPPERGVILADAVMSATNWGESYSWNSTDPRKDGVLEFNADGWPAEDFTFILRPTDRLLHQGTYLLSFEGMAEVEIGVGGGEIRSADGTVSFGSRTSVGGLDGYDAGSNTTTLQVVISNTEKDSFWPRFQNTRRSAGSAVGTGLRNVRMQRPSGIGSATPHAVDELFAREAVETLETFVTFRWNDVNGVSDANGTSLGRWEDRRMWGPNRTNTSFTGENHEYKILLSNHTGRDLYIQVPHLADDDYILKLARLIRYGADATGTPYSAEVSDPYFPPLNPNLRVNVEYSNEIPWNSAGQYPQSNWARLQPEVRRQAGDPSWNILNFDNLIATESSAGKAEGLSWGKRFTALRTVEVSDIFRSVFGDADMPAPGKPDPRVRVLYMYQYDNSNGTATDAFNFIDGYFNKVHPLSSYTGDPKPVSYFIYGGGAATYYASADRLGVVADHPLSSAALGTFETPVLADGVADVSPVGSPWTFTGTAGIYRQTKRFAGSYGSIPAPSSSVDAYTYRGVKITVGAADVALYEVGRYIHPGNSGTATISVYAADNPGSAIFSRSFELSGWPQGGTAWQRVGRNIFVISNKAYSAPIILQAGKSYYILSTEANGGNVHSANVPFTPPVGVTVDGAARGSYNSSTSSWTSLVVEATANRTYGPVNFRIAPAPSVTDTAVTLGFLHDSRNPIEDNRVIDEDTFSPQAAFIAGNGSMETDITFTEPGYYGLVYCLAQKQDQTPYDSATSATSFGNPLMIYLVEDGVARSITPSGQTDTLPAVTGWTHEGYWTKPFSGYDFFGSAPFEITDTSKTYRIRFVGMNAGTEDVVLLDNIQLASADKMTEGEIPSGGGFAEGAPDVSNWEARVMSMYKYAQSFGLRAISYEGGWYPGGDANKMPLQFTSSFFAESMVAGEENAINALNRAGLAMNTDYTLNFAMPDAGVSDPSTYSRIRAWRALNATLQVEPTNGQPLTSIFTAESGWLSLRTNGSTLEDGGWISWNVLAPASDLYDFALETTGSGTVSVRVNEHEVPVSGTAGGMLTSSTPVYLSKGLHTIRVLNRGANADLVSLTVTRQNQSAGFNGLTGSPGNAEVYLEWPAMAGASGYHVYYKSRLASDFTRITVVPITSTAYSVTGLTNDTTYNFVVTWVDGSGNESAYSNQISVVPAEIAAVLAWEFDDTIKTSGSLPPTLQSANVAGGVSLSTGPWKNFDTNGTMIVDAAGFGGGWSLGVIPLRDDHYIGFSFTPAAGKTMRIAGLEFGFWWARNNAVTVNDLICELRYSDDGFATYEVVPLSPDPGTVNYSNGNSSAGVRLTADLSQIASLQALESGTVAEFRIHFYGEGCNYWGIGKLGPTTDDLIVYGGLLAQSSVEAPVITPAGGTYTGSASVTLSTPTAGATIHYTTDGSTPSRSVGNLYSGPILIESSATLRAMAWLDGMSDSAVSTATYVIEPPPNQPPVVASDLSAAPALVSGISTVLSLEGTDADTANLTYSWSASGPASVSFSDGGAVTLPQGQSASVTASFSAPGMYVFDAQISDGEYSVSATSLNVEVVATASAVTVSPSAIVVAANGLQAFSASVDNQFGDPLASAVIDWTATGGMLNNTSGTLVNWTAPSVSGTVSLEAHSGAVSGVAVVTVDSLPLITSTQLSPALELHAYAATLEVSGTDLPMSWSIVSGSLPSGLSLDGVNGTIVGTPAIGTFGSYSFTVQVMDGDGDIDSVALTLDVDELVPAEIVELLAWEFDDTAKTSGSLPPTLQSTNVEGGVSLSTGPWKNFDTNTFMIVDAAGFGGGWSLGVIPLRDDHYIGFSFTPVAGTVMEVTEMQFGFWWTRNNAVTVNDLICELRYSDDGFATYEVVPLSPDPGSVNYSNGNSSAGSRLTADLSQIASLQALESGTVAEFQFHFYGEGCNYWGIGKLGPTTDDLILYGGILIEGQ